MKPFADDAASEAVGGLTIENGATRLSIYGQLEITRDKRGLRRARKVKALIDRIVEALETDDSLPETTAETIDEPIEVKNPFT
jgi:hypothetical protein